MIWITYQPYRKGYYKTYDIDLSDSAAATYTLAVTDTMTDSILAKFDLLDNEEIVRQNQPLFF